MLSLDKKILDPQSAVALRMRRYGGDEPLYILVPALNGVELSLNQRVRVYGVKGNKILQFFRLLYRAHALIVEFRITRVATQDPFFLGLIALFLKWRSGVLFEAQVHGDFYSTDYYRRSGFANFVRYYLGKFVLRRADFVRAVSLRIMESLVAQGIQDSHIIVRPISIDANAITSYKPRLDLHVRYPQFRKIFLVLGRFDRVKNIPWLLQIFREVADRDPSIGLLLVGEGAEKSLIQDTIRRLHLEDNVMMEPWTADPWSYLKTADCLLFPSLSEGYGMVVVEAIAAGCRVVMNDVGVANNEVLPSARVTILSINGREAWVRAMLRI